MALKREIVKAEYFALIDDKGYIHFTGNIDRLLEVKRPGLSIAKVTEYKENWDVKWRPGDGLTCRLNSNN